MNEPFLRLNPATTSKENENKEKKLLTIVNFEMF